jgi:hypothetical protein
VALRRDVYHICCWGISKILGQQCGNGFFRHWLGKWCFLVLQFVEAILIMIQVIWGFGLGHILLVVMAHTFGFYSWIWEEGNVTLPDWDDEDTTSGENKPLLEVGFQSIDSGDQTSGGELPV